MRNFDECLARMKDLYTYGATSLNEDKSSNIEHTCIGADNKAYGIIRECNKFYIKTAPADKVNVFEAYDYIGGFNNKKDFEYASYSAALKNFDLKMMSLNEAFDGNAQTQSLNPSKKEDLVIEGTEEMRKEIARQRQIMENSEKIGNYDVYPKGYNDVEEFESNDEDKPYTEKAEAKLDKDMPLTKDKPEDEGAPYGDDAKTEEYETINEGKEEGVCPNCGEKECVCEDTGDWEETITHVMKEEEGDDELVADDDVEVLDNEPAEEPEDIEVVDDEAEVEEPVEDEPEEEAEVESYEDLESEIESIKARLEALENEMDEPAEDAVEAEPVEEPEETDEIPEEPEANEYELELPEDEIDECGKGLCEGKENMMNNIIESVVSQFLKEDEIHDFGKHPGYRKKPMTTPPADDDKPFGTSIGDGKPYEKAVKVITDSIMDVLKKKI